ncbi:ribonuclease E/G [Qipengyuania sp. MTN3-11]|uniref:ribonuclease E/G n=1 Tax=Qipengyuania sp. MTN3-11 TaxID=3056557 RepID=UPI0036F2886E
MAEWLVEEGIGEIRALLVEGDTVLASRLRWPAELHAGQTVEAKLVSRATGAKRGTALSADGTEILLDRLPGDTSEGASFPVEITRAAIAERGRYKRPLGRIAEPSPSLGMDPFSDARRVARFAPGHWEAVWDAAWDASVAFPGGSLLFAVTPAMTVIDIDGGLPPAKLAVAAVAPIARALRQFDCGGSVGIDFPSLERKSDRKAVDAALGEALAGWPHERTAMNGFGFVQIVSRLEGPSLLQRMANARVGMAARMAIRRAEMTNGTGPILALVAHPAIAAKFKPDWLAELARRTAKEVRVESDPGIALNAAHAQMVER